MAVSLPRALKLLDSLTNELSDRISEVDRNDEYYRGEHPLAFASDEFREYFSQRYQGFSDNWCQVVADAPVERLEPTGVRLPGETLADSDLWRVWRANEADATCDLAFLDSIISRRSFALVWGNPDDEDTPSITFEHPSQAIVDYDPETGGRRAGLKLWRDGDLELATLYLSDQVWKFERTVTPQPSGMWIPPSASDADDGWRARSDLPTAEPWPLPNPMGAVPLVELPNRPRLVGEPMSDLGGVIAMQDSVNLLWAYLFNAADFASFPQRVVLGADKPKVPILDDNGDVKGEREVPLEKFAVDRVVWLEDPNSKIGEWKAANLDVYTQVIEVQVSHMASQTRTPHHYIIGKMANLSAEALKAAETGLVKRTEEKAEHFGRALREVFRLVALAQGDPAKARAVRTGRVLWKDVETRSEAQLADQLLKLRDVGFPFEYLAERYGLDSTEVERILSMRRRETNELMAAGEALLDRPEPDEVPAA